VTPSMIGGGTMPMFVYYDTNVIDTNVTSWWYGNTYTRATRFETPPETFEERKRRLARERTSAAIAIAKLLSPIPLPERQYDRDRREGRAVGVDSRYRVMLC
jgi:hypothetical protein